MSEGRKPTSYCNHKHQCVCDSGCDARNDNCEPHFTFTLPELAARDAEIRAEVFNSAFPNAAKLVTKHVYDKGYAAGVEAALANLYCGGDEPCDKSLDCVSCTECRIRALLPAGYKSLEDIAKQARREALEEVASRHAPDCVRPVSGPKG